MPSDLVVTLAQWHLMSVGTDCYQLTQDVLMWHNLDGIWIWFLWRCSLVSSDAEHTLVYMQQSKA